MRPVRWSRAALDALKQAVAYIARDNPEAARKIANAIRRTGEELGRRSTGRKGRMAGTFEKSVAGAPYAIDTADGKESVVILHVIHTARDWRPGRWPDS
jgi:plasmid stabilization system protein ParE